MLVIYKQNNKIERAFKPNFGNEQPEIIWQGENWEAFTAETGLDESHLAGLKKDGETIVYDANQEQAYKQSLQPEAQPRDLAEALADGFSTASFTELLNLLSSPQILAALVALRVSKNQLTLEEYENLKTMLANSAKAQGLEAAKVDGLVETIEAEFKEKRKFKAVK